ncbi:MAG: HAD family hydrolase, partial [Firmicutes bacterium]|nr:HAD family hydrolase [Bacillota bacterium]
MNVLACTGIPELDEELKRFFVIQSVAVVDDIVDTVERWVPEAVLLSVYLPSFRADIVDVCRRLRRLGIRVVVMCGDNPENAWPFFEIGIHDFIPGEKASLYE